ncbi:MAG: GAF domain-containing protein [Candidatus Dormibacteraeota bacterium]|uniref:GAF domain-containing protein n=1 Tax=Candidatus Dormiibacter inghamiae TaxID=3127013 RepID=A0A934KFU5_9BACT|nr:GAF domain-containing protein [Candidatus Dormibacteraeota bacterium]MBJ7605275.1 GAF domain-containing protein [Candidatus Dormibacteraeota bacterium]
MIASSERLAAIDLDTIAPESLLAAIEQESARLFGLQAVDLEPATQVGSAMDAVPMHDGPVLPIVGGRFVGHGRLRAGWEPKARIFAAHVTSLLRAHAAVKANADRQAEIIALYASVGQLTAQLDVKKILRTVVERARDLLSSDVSYIMLLDAGGRTLRMRVVVGNRTSTFADINRPVMPGVSTHIGTPVMTPDFLNERDLDHDPETDRLARLEGLKAVLGVPLRTELAVLGTLYVANRYVKTFSEREVSVLRSLGEQAALALDNARLYEDALKAAAAATEARAEAEAHLHRLRRVGDLHGRLTEVLLGGEGVSGVAQTLADDFSIRLVVTDWRHREIASRPDGPRRDGPPSPAFLRRPEVRRALTSCTSSYTSATVGCEYFVTPVAARHELLGYVWTAWPSVSDDAELVRTSIEQAARVIALEMLREREAIETERRLRRDFIYELLSDRAPDPAIIETRARQVWARFGMPHRPLVVAPVPTGASPASFIKRARRLLLDERPADFIAAYGHHLIALTAITDRAGANMEAEKIRIMLGENGMVASVAVGATCIGLLETRTSILTTSRLLDLLVPRQVLWAEGLEPLTVLFDRSQRDRLATFVRESLAPFEGNERLMSTLQSYYESGSNRARAARRLRVHVNTLRQRLERIESLLGGSVDDSLRAVHCDSPSSLKMPSIGPGPSKCREHTSRASKTV